MGSFGPPVHVLLVSFPGQGHVNPLLRLGKLLASKGGILVTFSTTQDLGNRMAKANPLISSAPTPVGSGLLRFEFFSDGLPDGEDDTSRFDLDAYLNILENAGKRELTLIIDRLKQEGRPVTCLINNPFVPWVSDLAESLGIPSAMLWVQSCACFSAYYHYQNKLVPFPNEEEPELDVQLPNMPLLKFDEIPSFLHPSTPYPFLARAILGQFKNLSKPFCVLMETFQELEDDLIKYMSKLCPIRPVGPLFKNPNITSSEGIRADFIKADDCLEWLDTKKPSSVVYISFGSVVTPKQEQVEEIAHGLLNSGLSFLWVLRQPHKDWAKPYVLPEGFLEKVGENGKIVQWCSQDRVLAHDSVACFVTHCGWNSTMEALSSGIPVVAFPQWGDQVTDAKYLVDMFKVGVRLCRGEAENRIISRDEVEKCLKEAVEGDKAKEMKANVLKWKKAAEEAVAEGGSSDRNIDEFVDDLKSMSITSHSKWAAKDQ